MLQTIAMAVGGLFLFMFAWFSMSMARSNGAISLDLSKKDERVASGLFKVAQAVFVLAATVAVVGVELFFVLHYS